jgi:hypothetical protein
MSNPYQKSVATKLPRMGFNNDKPSNAYDEKMKLFDAHIQNAGCHLEVYHLVMLGGKYDFWGCAMKNNEKHYWTWKPMAIEIAIQTDYSVGLFKDLNLTLDDMMYNTRAAHLRETPRGENKKAEYKLKPNGSVDIFILYGFLERPCTPDDVKNHAQSLAIQFKNECVQRAYQSALTKVMYSPKAFNDAAPGKGALWTKLAAAAETKNIVYQELGCLSELLLDEKIEEIFHICYGQLVPGESPSMWPKAIHTLAFGEQK